MGVCLNKITLNLYYEELKYGFGKGHVLALTENEVLIDEFDIYTSITAFAKYILDSYILNKKYQWTNGNISFDRKFAVVEGVRL